MHPYRIIGRSSDARRDKVWTVDNFNVCLLDPIYANRRALNARATCGKIAYSSVIIVRTDRGRIMKFSRAARFPRKLSPRALLAIPVAALYHFHATLSLSFSLLRTIAEYFCNLNVATRYGGYDMHDISHNNHSNGKRQREFEIAHEIDVDKRTRDFERYSVRTYRSRWSSPTRSWRPSPAAAVTGEL